MSGEQVFIVRSPRYRRWTETEVAHALQRWFGGAPPDVTEAPPLPPLPAAAANPLGERHMRHGQQCSCLNDSAVCCDEGCPCKPAERWVVEREVPLGNPPGGQWVKVGETTGAFYVDDHHLRVRNLGDDE